MNGKFGAVLSWDFSGALFCCDLRSLALGHLCAQSRAGHSRLPVAALPRQQKNAAYIRLSVCGNQYIWERAKLVKRLSQVPETLSTFISCQTPSINQQ